MRLQFLLTAALALVASVAYADDKPPELRLPRLKPVVLESFVKSAESIDPNVVWLKVPDAWAKLVDEETEKRLDQDDVANGESGQHAGIYSGVGAPRDRRFRVD